MFFVSKFHDILDVCNALHIILIIHCLRIKLSVNEFKAHYQPFQLKCHVCTGGYTSLYIHVHVQVICM